jgi:hypothetical protein
MASMVLKKAGTAELSTDDQVVVEELKTVILKHLDRTALSLAQLVGLAFTGSLGSGGNRDEKLERARARGVLARKSLMVAEGGCLSSEEVSDLLQISKTAVLKRLHAGKLLAFREERLRAARYPRWQFDDHGRVMRGFEGILAVLNHDDRLDEWAKLLFFLQEKAILGGKRPLDLLRAGRLEEVRLAAQAYVE